MGRLCSQVGLAITPINRCLRPFIMDGGGTTRHPAPNQSVHSIARKFAAKKTHLTLGGVRVGRGVGVLVGGSGREAVLG